MKKKWLKIVTPILIIAVIIMAIMTGKSILNKKDTSKSLDIPENGIVSSSVFNELKGTDDMLLFNGDSNEIKYQWLFLGTDIQDPKDTNLLIDFDNEISEEVEEELNSSLIQKFDFKEENRIESNPYLSIEVNTKWNCDEADIYKIDKESNSPKVLTKATVENGEKTTISFSVSDNEGMFYIVGKELEEDKIADNGIVDNNSEKDSGEKKDNDNKKSKYLTDDINKGKKDKYLTDPTPPGKPSPTEWQDVKVDKSKVKSCTLSIRCDTLLIPKNYEIAKSNGKSDMIPSNGIIYGTKTVEFYEGEFVFDVLLREVKKAGIHMEYSMTPIYNSNYIEGINNLYEFDGGELSGWMYKVNGWFPNYGCSRYLLKNGDVIEWVYTCDLGKDVGCEWLEDTQ